ncbi:Serine/threonine protein kinase [Halobacillus alkaliphilus]|uniref:Serine/threonine protein kinase n=1 Tax=Halobacillus alkaliphilus TaxID=396056 RepID=A0A1I2MDQ5_9BACI|nr:protein kinase family protein [Halobacillus alkaliphilus]SFF88919.1 Serine/threonine protein kinase [Halobacillus alkaliphilus]
MIILDRLKQIEREPLMIYRGKKLEFQKAEKLGRGGNGVVHEIVCIPPSDNRLVVKILTYSQRNFEKKFTRFKHEVLTVQRLYHMCEGLLPIIDYYLPDDVPPKNDPAWFVMPFARQFKDHIFGNQFNIIQKMKLVKDIGRILSRIHNEGYSHRDIKLDNLLIYNDHVVLSDFGLVSHEEYDRLTGVNERVGPWNTIAPEMQREAREITDAQPADVYSFAKLIWIILMEDEDCFEGQYGKEKVFALNVHQFAVDSIECIERLLIDSTNDDPGQRPTVLEVLNYIDQWERVNSDEVLLKQEKRMVAEESIRRTLRPASTIFTEFEAILDIIERIIDSYVFSSHQFNDLSLKICKPSQVPGCLEVGDERTTYIFKPTKITLETKPETHFILEIEEISDEEIQVLEDEIIMSEDVTALDLLTATSEVTAPKIVLHAEERIVFKGD